MQPRTLLDTDVLSGLMHNRGQLIADADILIAATALVHDLVLATNNLADFGRIDSLQIDNWLA